jgi:arylsulfatase A-like enzyme/Tfp pilus assembly protein PilF
MSQSKSPHLIIKPLLVAGLWLLAALVLLLAAVLLSCSTLTSPPLPNVILISIDTCRADYLSCYGYPKKTTPNIDALADRAVLFENVISPVPLTLPAHCSMLTGTIPPHHAVHDNYDYWLEGSNITLAEILRDNGFATAAFVSAFVLDSQFAIDQGFDTYYDHFEQQADQFQANERRADQTTRLALDWLDEHSRENFFLFLHYYDPHTDYDPPEPFFSKFADNLYAGEIAYTDHYIGQLLQKLKSLGIFDSSLIIITSDHGEMLAEHGEDEHGYFIYQSALKVPLIFKLPGRHRHQRVNGLVALVDIIPTVCGLLGIAPPTPLHGRDLSPHLHNRSISSEERHVYAESLYPTKYGGNSLLGLVGRRYKYIQTTRPEIYDLQTDPAESDNLIETHSQLAAALREQLRQRLEQNVRKLKANAKFAPDDETIKRLESLGYVAAPVTELFEFDRDRPDPKDLLDFYLATTKVNRLMISQNFDQAKALCEQLLPQHPDYYGLHRTLGKIAASRGNRQNAKAYMLKSLQLNPNQADLHNHLGMILAEENHLAEAIHHLGKSLALNPNQAGTHFASANVLERQGKLDQAADHYTTILKLDPSSAAAHNNLASVLLRQGKYKQAELHCTKALQINPQLPEAYYNLGNIRFQQGKFRQAVINYQKALTLRPNWPDAQKNLNIAKTRSQSFAP